MPTYIIFLGPPGAGKGTQAKVISAELGIPQVSTGDLFRAMKTQETEFARRVQQIMASGELVPDDVTIQMVEGRLNEADAEQGALMDGFPRTVPQADAFSEMLESEFDSEVLIVPLMNISENEAVRRISGRRSCPECKTVYHVDFNPPKVDEVCDNDGTALVQREDDRPEVVRERYQVYLDNTAPLVDYYRSKNLLVEIDATQKIDRITSDLLTAIKSAIES